MSVKPNQWCGSKNILWFVFNTKTGAVWLMTASFYRKSAIESWERQAGKTWGFWYRRGFRCQRAKIKYQIQP